MLLRGCLILLAMAALLACQTRDRAACRDACVDSFDLCISMAPTAGAVDRCVAVQRTCEQECGGN